MNVSAPFINRPVATTIIMVALMVFGLVGYSKLPVSELPNIDLPTIVVYANLPGADPENMASTVAMPLEKSLCTIDGINAISSINSTGATKITIAFTLERNIDAAAQDVQAAISKAIKNLPNDLPNPPYLRKVNPDQAPILYLALTADHMPLSTLNDYAESYLAQSLSMINGVAEVTVYGSQRYAVRINLNPVAMSTRNLGVDTVVTALKQASDIQPAGVLDTAQRSHLLKTKAQLTNAAAYNEAIVAVDNGNPIRVKDIGIAKDDVANDKAATWYNGKRAIVLAVQKQPGTNTVAIADQIKQALPKLAATMPGAIKIAIVNDRAEFIKNSIGELKMTLVIAVLLVLVITYLFFKNFAATLITAFDFPIALVATFMLMYILQYSLDNVSLMGLVLAVGFVIDDTIVVLENILRYVDQGKSRMQAALLATEEICFTVIAMTLSLVAVFIPIIFMDGIIGRLFREFAVVVAVAILFSGFVSLTLTPMLRSRFLAVNATASNVIVARFNDYFAKSKQLYLTTLEWSLNNPKIVWSGVVVILFATIILCYQLPKGFIPTEDTYLIRINTQVQEGVVFKDFCKYQQQAAAIVAANPNVTGVVSSVGQSSGSVNAATNGQLLLQLKPSNQRSETVHQIIKKIRKELTVVPGLQVFLQAPPSIRLGSTSGIGTYQYILQGTNWDKLRLTTIKVQQALRKIPGVTDLNSDFRLVNPELQIHILRDKAAMLGISPSAIASAIYMAYGNYQVNNIISDIDDYPVIIKIDPKFQNKIESLNLLNLRSNTGAMVPLNAVVQIKDAVGPVSLNHYGQLPAITIAFNISNNVALGDITTQISKITADLIPDDIAFIPVGTAETFKKSLVTLPILFVFTILVIYMVLAILYEHFIHPLTILSALPFAAFGALFSLFVCNQELNVYSFIGVILLVGLVKKNGIIMLDFALDAKVKQNLTARDAIMQACNIRYRPIMMTTMAALLSVLPLALSSGVGCVGRRSLGVAVFGGLFFSQFLTLYITPLFYLTMEKFSARLQQIFCK